MNMKMEAFEEKKEDKETEKLKAELNRIVEVGTALENVPDLDSAIKILEDGSDIGGAEEYLAPIYIFKQHPTLENAQMVPDPCGFSILDVLKRFVTEEAMDDEGFEPIQKSGKRSVGGKMTSKKKGKKNVEKVSVTEEVVADVDQPIENIPEDVPTKEDSKVVEEIKSEPNPKLIYQEYLKEKGVSPKVEKFHPDTRKILDRDPDSAEMDAKLSKWADDALHPKKEKNTPPTRAEILARPFPYQDRPQSEVLDILGKAFAMENKNNETEEPGFVRKLIEKFEKRLKYAKQFDGIENVNLNKVPPEDHEAFLIKGDEEKYLNKLMHSREIPSVEDVLYAGRVSRTKKEKPKAKHVKLKDTWLRRFMNRFLNKQDVVKKHPTYGKIKRSGGKQDGRGEIEEEIN